MAMVTVKIILYARSMLCKLDVPIHQYISCVRVQQGCSVVQAAEEEVTQLYKGNAGLIDSVAELKVQVNAAARCSCHTVDNHCCMQSAGSSACPAISMVFVHPLCFIACLLQSAVGHSQLSTLAAVSWWWAMHRVAFQHNPQLPYIACSRSPSSHELAQTQSMCTA